MFVVFACAHLDVGVVGRRGVRGGVCFVGGWLRLHNVGRVRFSQSKIQTFHTVCLVLEWRLVAYASMSVHEDVEFILIVIIIIIVSVLLVCTSSFYNSCS